MRCNFCLNGWVASNCPNIITNAEESIAILPIHKFFTVKLFYQLLCLIGEGFGEDSDYVNGGVVQVRNKGDKAAIWTSDYKNKTSIMNIG